MKNLILLLILVATPAGMVDLLATSPTTNPVGLIQLNMRGGSDTSFTLPLTRASEFTSVIDTVSENTVNVSNASWGIGDWTYGTGNNPSNTYYVLLTSGLMEGMYYTITSNSVSSFDVDPADEIDIETQGVQSGDTFKIIPYWTLNTVFPDGKGLHATPDVNNPQSFVFETNPDAVGVNNPLSTAYFYHDGSQGPAGWYIAGGIGAGIQDDHILLPDAYYIARNPDIGTTNALLSGDVLINDYRTVVSRLADSQPQDNYMALSFPVDITLAQTNLASSPAFSVTPNVNVPQDRVILYDNETPLINKPLSTSYFYHDGSQGPAGWYIEGNIGAGIQDNEPVIKAGIGFVIRKQTGVTASDYWQVSPPYENN